MHVNQTHDVSREILPGQAACRFWTLPCLVAQTEVSQSQGRLYGTTTSLCKPSTDSARPSPSVQDGVGWGRWDGRCAGKGDSHTAIFPWLHRESSQEGRPWPPAPKVLQCLRDWEGRPQMPAPCVFPCSRCADVSPPLPGAVQTRPRCPQRRKPLPLAGQEEKGSHPAAERRRPGRPCLSCLWLRNWPQTGQQGPCRFPDPPQAAWPWGAILFSGFTLHEATPTVRKTHESHQEVLENFSPTGAGTVWLNRF